MKYPGELTFPRMHLPRFLLFSPSPLRQSYSRPHFDHFPASRCPPSKNRDPFHKPLLRATL